jgi:menaquinone-dependent protoporphyrinogen oxidase
MDNRILVTYATKHGATTEIAEKIGQTLQQAGLLVDVLPVEQVDSLGSYDAVVLGSAVYAGHWRKEAVDFLKDNEELLAERPVWIFSSGPTGEGDPAALLKGWRFPAGQWSVVEHIHPRDIMVFHGDLNMDKLNLAEKIIIKGVKAPTGDFRDWEMISSWATGIAQAMQQVH